MLNRMGYMGKTARVLRQRMALWVTLAGLLCSPQYLVAQANYEWTWMGGSPAFHDPGTFSTVGGAVPYPPGLFAPVTWTGADGIFWMFGGDNRRNNGRNVASAMWRFDPLRESWTWVHGPAAFNRAGTYGLRGISDAANVPGARAYGALSWTGTDGALWLYGGTGFDARHNWGGMSDLWRFDPDSRQWTWIHGPDSAGQRARWGRKGVAAAANTPGPRNSTAATWTDAQGRLWFFGGNNSANYADIWMFDPQILQWTWMAGDSLPGTAPRYGQQGLSSGLNSPGARTVYARWSDANDDLWIFGGEGAGARQYSELWRLDTRRLEWTWVHGDSLSDHPGFVERDLYALTPAGGPAARFGATATWTDPCGNFWLFGGFRKMEGYSLGDLWTYLPRFNRWAWMGGYMNAATPEALPTGNYGQKKRSAAENWPPARFSAAAWSAAHGELWMFGGIEGGGRVFHDLWRYRPPDICCEGWPLPPQAAFDINPEPLRPVQLGQAFFSFQSRSRGGTRFEWDFGDGNRARGDEVQHRYTRSGNYTVSLSVSYDGECVETARRSISVFAEGALFLPNAFSPNGDGHNDHFAPLAEGMERFRLLIFDRWGRLLRSIESADGWDGRDASGAAAPEGVYAYQVEAWFFNGYHTRQTGTITVLR